jgi:hypothetical protein
MQNHKKEKSSISIMTIIGIFFGVFGLSLLFALFYTQTERGRIVNLVCSFVFILMGVGSIIIAKKSK